MRLTNYHSLPQLLQCHCLCTFRESSPHTATDPTFDKPDIFFILVDPQVGHLGILSSGTGFFVQPHSLPHNFHRVIPFDIHFLLQHMFYIHIFHIQNHKMNPLNTPPIPFVYIPTSITLTYKKATFLLQYCNKRYKQ